MGVLNFIRIIKLAHTSSIEENKEITIDFSKDFDFFESRKMFNKGLNITQTIDSFECKKVHDKYMKLCKTLDEKIQSHKFIEQNKFTMFIFSEVTEILIEAQKTAEKEAIADLIDQIDQYQAGFLTKFTKIGGSYQCVKACRDLEVYYHSLFNPDSEKVYKQFIENTLMISKNKVSRIFKSLNTLLVNFCEQYKEDLERNMETDSKNKEKKVYHLCKFILNYPNLFTDISFVLDETENKKFVKEALPPEFENMIVFIESISEDCPNFVELYESAGILTASEPLFRDLQEDIIMFRKTDSNYNIFHANFLFPDALYHHFLKSAADINIELDERKKFQIKKASLLINNIFILSRTIRQRCNVLKEMIDELRNFVTTQLGYIPKDFKAGLSFKKVSSIYSDEMIAGLSKIMLVAMHVANQDIIRWLATMKVGFSKSISEIEYFRDNIKEASKSTYEYFQKFLRGICIFEICTILEYECRIGLENAMKLGHGSENLQKEIASNNEKLKNWKYFLVKLGLNP